LPSALTLTPSGSPPTLTSNSFLCATRSYAVSAESSSFDAYSIRPSGLRSNISGSSPTSSFSTTLRVAMSHTAMWLPSLQATNKRARSGLSCRWRGRLQIGIEPVTSILVASITFSALSFSLVTNTWPVSRACAMAAAKSMEAARATRAAVEVMTAFICALR
jgi:hypothetical protein